ncbi:MAG: SpoIIE family protein phosphatase [Oscillatoriales cyanobacterium C42_A2020_001]|nr:SpoIIE family protein phosphatase [Leptolyngbyaceae cyanobacterium C42_A2020_001]
MSKDEQQSLVAENQQLRAEICKLKQDLADLRQTTVELQQALANNTQAHRKIEAALQASEAELRALFAAMTDIVIVKDFNGRYLKIAPTRLDNLYKLPEELIGRTEYEVFPQDTADRFVGYVQTVLTTQQAMTVEFCLPLRGEDRWFSTNIAPLSANSVVWVARDISDRKHTEEALIHANQQVTRLNECLKQENLRMSAELEVTRRLQQMILPREEELEQIAGLDIAGFMQPATEVGGDYYDVLQHNGKVKIGIGDVTGHGLESSMVMLMVKTAVRTLIANGETDPVRLLNTVNQLIYDNTRRMQSYKNMTLMLLEYEAGILRLSGQHEELIVVRVDGGIEHIDTFELGFPLGLESDISQFITEAKIQLNQGDVAVLYTDGITEATNVENIQYGLERMHTILQNHRDRPSSAIRQALIEDLMQHIGTQEVFDDITLLVLKQK